MVSDQEVWGANESKVGHEKPIRCGIASDSAGHHVLWLRITEPLTDKHTRSGIADVASGVMNAH